MLVVVSGSSKGTQNSPCILVYSRCENTAEMTHQNSLTVAVFRLFGLSDNPCTC